MAHLAGLQEAAKRAADLRVDSVAEEVPWDLNTRSAEARLAPFHYVLNRPSRPQFSITQRKAAANEPGAPHSGTGTALWTAAIGLAKLLEHMDASGSFAGKSCLELGCGTGLVGSKYVYCGFA